MSSEEKQVFDSDNEDSISDDEYTETETEDEYEDETYLQKFKQETEKSFLADFHPESKVHNNEEVKKFAMIKRDKDGIIIDPLHRTVPFLTKYEFTRIVGQRAKQIDNGSVPFVEVPKGVIDGYNIAIMELEQKQIPFIIRRPIPGGGSEYWRVSDLEYIRY